MSNDGLDGGTSAQLTLDNTEDAALLAGDEDAAGILRVVAAGSPVDIGPLDRTAGEGLGAVNDGPQKMTVVRVMGERPRGPHPMAPGGPAACGCDCER